MRKYHLDAFMSMDKSCKEGATPEFVVSTYFETLVKAKPEKVNIAAALRAHSFLGLSLRESGRALTLAAGAWAAEKSLPFTTFESRFASTILKDKAKLDMSLFSAKSVTGTYQQQ